MNRPSCACGAEACSICDVTKSGHMTREPLCEDCLSHKDFDIDVVVEPGDLSAVVGSGICWCDASRRLHVDLKFCPQHGVNPLQRNEYANH